MSTAEQSLRTSLKQHPNNAHALAHLGMILLEQKRPKEAITAFQQSLALNPHASMVRVNLGLAHSSLGQLDQALQCYQEAARTDESNDIAFANLGAMLQRLQRLDDAAIALERAVKIDPNKHTSWSNLGVVLTHLLRTKDAVAALRRAVELQPQSSTNWINLGVAILDQSRVDEAIVCFRRAIEVNPTAADAWNNLGTALKESGDLQEAAEAYRTSLDFEPNHAVHSNLLFCLTYDTATSQQELAAEHRVWAALYGHPLDTIAPHHNTPDPHRPLRVGYFSPDFRTHAVARFIEPILAFHDPATVEVFAYAEVPQADATTHRLQQLVPHWRWTSQLDDDALESLIRADKIDILIDLAGHTGRNRLRALSRKPAPIQALWMGYPTTTSLPAFDYLLTDAGLNPPHEADDESIANVEQLYRLPCGSACFLPSPESPPVRPLPALRNGYLTFGAPHNLAKVNDGVLQVWAKVFQALPTARLLMFRGGLNGHTSESLRQRFAAAGGNPQQLDLRDVSNASHGYAGYMDIYGEIDLCLDTFPANGGTTTCESLWMGVPWITLRGQRFFGRQTTSVQQRLDLHDFIANTSDAYISKAVEWSNRLTDLITFRTTLRDRFSNSTLGNAKTYTQGFEFALRDIWQTWCKQQLTNEK